MEAGGTWGPENQLSQHMPNQPRGLSLPALPSKLGSSSRGPNKTSWKMFPWGSRPLCRDLFLQNTRVVAYCIIRGELRWQSGYECDPGLLRTPWVTALPAAMGLWRDSQSGDAGAEGTGGKMSLINWRQRGREDWGQELGAHMWKTWSSS